MKLETSRPALLVLSLVLIAGAIALLELRLGRAESGRIEPGGAQQTETAPTTPEDPSETANAAEATAARDLPVPEPREAGGKRAPVDAAAERIAAKEAEFGRAAEITGPTGFVNTAGVSLADLRGEKVVLLEFWTYSCYNCQNVQPYMNAWHDAYADDGLQVIGVHKPEFEFEKDPAGVQAAVAEAGIEYPVVLDNDDATWDAYDNRYWPAIYLIDADGFVRYRHFGEGAYEETEARIQELLAERDRIAPPAF